VRNTEKEFYSLWVVLFLKERDSNNLMGQNVIFHPIDGSNAESFNICALIFTIEALGADGSL